MITTTQIISLLSNLEVGKLIRIFSENDIEITITDMDTVEDSEDGTVMFVKKANGNITLVNLEKVICVCEGKRFI